MKRFLNILLSTILLLPALLLAQTVINHQIIAEIKPIEQKIHVIDSISFENTNDKLQIPFLIHKGGEIKTPQKNVTLKKLSAEDAKQHFPQIFSNGLLLGSSNLDFYLLNKAANVNSVTIEYERKIHHAIQAQGSESERAMSDSPGIISEKGVYLSGESFWYPYFGNEFVTFNLSVKLPVGWKSVSQGERIHVENEKTYHLDTWQETKPQDNIYLIAAKFTEYSQAAGSITAMAFLREPDDALAQKYLDTTAQYLEMYRQLIGTFPYKKFALVENFWETGFGMPSFTLLGSRIIRFPFILHSSYPHELLHNWWGNSVYVDYQKGNWAEGLTAYLADHLVKEQRGKGQEHRRNTLQKYTNYTQTDNDFALMDFVSRHNAVTEAVGYGKTLMFFHMLRLKLGDELFVRGLQRFNQKYRFKMAGFADIEKIFSQAAGSDLRGFFKQWIEQAGAADLKLENVNVNKSHSDKYQLQFDLIQAQKGQAYQLDLPIAITTQTNKNAVQQTLHMTSKKQQFVIELDNAPLKLDVDPEFDVFRRLDLNETPPALSQMFGAGSALIVLPSNATKKLKQTYKQLAENWSKSRETKMEIISDNKLKELPVDKAIWLFGAENSFRQTLEKSLQQYPVKPGTHGINIFDQQLKYANSSVIMVARNPLNPNMPMALVSADNVAAVSGLGRKLPHYGRYSYLAFNGEEPTNFFKGQWPIVDSPLSKDLSQRLVQTAKLSPRAALAQLSPVFSEKQMMQDIKTLASEDMQGRSLGSAGINKAAEYIANEFRSAGLRPLPAYKSYYQSWQQDISSFNQSMELNNVIGFIPGKNPKYQGESVIISAHYDHLGIDAPGVRQLYKGKIHYGADDNASGVAVMLELARLMAAKSQYERSVIFVAFTGEEVERLGSKYFVKHLKDFPLNKIMGVVNLDTVGRLENNPLIVFGTGSASEWVHIFRGVGFVTGVKIKSVAQEFGSSDQRSFLDVNVPGVQFFSGVNQDFHRPSDTIEKIDSRGLVKIATVLKETMDYLTARETPLTLMLNSKGESSKVSQRSTGGRKVSLGTVPDFTFEGSGVLVSSVVSSSPAEKAGILAKDIIVGIDDQQIEDLRGFAVVLRSLKPGDEISVKLKRQENKISVRAVLEAR